MEAAPRCCVGLVGDGDEIAAVENVEEMFGVALDDRDAPAWRTAGDMFTSLLKVLPPDAPVGPSAWERFAEALTLETGVDPRRITTDSLLLLPAKGTWGHVKEALFFIALLWLTIVALVVAF